jgi:ribonuclease D
MLAPEGRGGRTPDTLEDSMSGATKKEKTRLFFPFSPPSVIYHRYMTSTDIQLIDTAPGLGRLILALRQADRVAVDMEADSLHRYREKVCLIQICVKVPRVDEDAGGPDVLEAFLVDPLADIDLSAMLDVLKGRLLVMHGADYDLRMLHRDFKFIPERIFDTKIAAQLVGERHFGLAAVTEKFLGAAMDKGNQKADWSQRPLPEKLRVYGANDVLLLFDLADALDARLLELGRRDWHCQSCAAFIKDQAKDPDSSRREDPDLCWRVKGWQALSPVEQSMLRELWHWRDEESRAADRPPFKVLGNITLIALTQFAASRPDARLEDGPRLPRDFHGGRVERLRAAIDRGRQSAPAAPPPRRQSERLFRPFSPKLMSRLISSRDACAAQLGVDPTLLATRADLTAIAAEPPANAEALRGALLQWQIDLLWPGIMKAMGRR